jgi:hypothetical protein
MPAVMAVPVMVPAAAHATADMRAGAVTDRAAGDGANRATHEGARTGAAPSIRRSCAWTAPAAPRRPAATAATARSRFIYGFLSNEYASFKKAQPGTFVPKGAVPPRQAARQS